MESNHLLNIIIFAFYKLVWEYYLMILIILITNFFTIKGYNGFYNICILLLKSKKNMSTYLQVGLKTVYQHYTYYTKILNFIYDCSKLLNHNWC